MIKASCLCFIYGHFLHRILQNVRVGKFRPSSKLFPDPWRFMELSRDISELMFKAAEALHEDQANASLARGPWKS